MSWLATTRPEGPPVHRSEAQVEDPGERPEAREEALAGSEERPEAREEALAGSEAPVVALAGREV
jgi:hypothetical protein